MAEPLLEVLPDLIVLVRREGMEWKVKIIDFGLAVTQETAKHSLREDTPRARQTLLGASIAGTLTP